MSFTLIDLILFTGIVQGIFLMISLQFISKKNKAANSILMIIIGISIVVFAREMLSYQLDPKIFWRTALFTESTIYLFAPLLYLYFKVLVFRDTSQNKLSFKHYILSILMLCYFFWTLSLSLKEYMTILGAKGLYIVYFIMESVGMLSFAFYTYLSFQILNQVKNTTHPTEYTQKIARYIQYILIGISLITLSWAIGIFNIYILKNYNSFINYKLIWISITIFLFIVGYFSFTQPEVVRLPVKKKAPTKKRLTQEEINTIKEKITILIEEEHLYTQSDLNLKMLAKKLDTTANNLSWFLNSVYEKTFYEYINAYRVKAFLQKIEAGEHKKQTLLSIAMDAGFNSKSTFNKTFKSLMNDTPSRYIEKMYS
ncbi:DNA-binding transcriptional regulator SoxS [Kordia sp. SMS9]|uniref:helix-turn-helix domain-containing protein n=1 Tax=Kordia sp. SMS9 TaxID=2282170 RepID=UPI000E0D631A|nr:helix-turn-helix domain-containing protein [Kordia sp. SMS9]AXG72191.1 DNA-binding transcriptional regulator SoxS [Kordia sp. SMS9]